MPQEKKIVAIASDHAGYAMKEIIKREFPDYDWLDLGPDSDDSVDYPDYARKMADCLKEKRADFGVLLCGSGIGISIAANRFAHIRAALCTGPDMARLARQHNDANVLALGARLSSEDTIMATVANFLATDFEAGRHQRRVDKLGSMC